MARTIFGPGLPLRFFQRVTARDPNTVTMGDAKPKVSTMSAPLKRTLTLGERTALFEAKLKYFADTLGLSRDEAFSRALSDRPISNLEKSEIAIRNVMKVSGCTRAEACSQVMRKSR